MKIKRLLLAVLSVGVLYGIAQAWDVLSYRGSGANRNTYIFRMDNNGNVWDETGSATIGTSSYPYDFLYVDDITVGNDVTVGNDLTVTGNTTFSSPSVLYNRTSAQIVVTTPTYVGEEIYDTTLKQPVYSSGTSTCFDWVTSTGTRPSGY